MAHTREGVGPARVPHPVRDLNEGVVSDCFTSQTRRACRRGGRARRGRDGGRGDRPALRRLAGQQRPGGRHRPQPERRGLRRRRRLARRRWSARAVGHLRAEGRRRPAHLRAGVQERAVGHPGPIAEHRSERRGRGALDRFRRRRAHRAVGRVVRAQRGAGRRESDLRQPLRGRQQHLAARGTGPWIGCPVAEHQHRQGGREPLGRRRGRRGGRRSGAVGRVGRGGRQRQRLRQPRSDLRLQGRQAGRSQRAVCRLQAVGQRQRLELLLAAGRP